MSLVVVCVIVASFGLLYYVAFAAEGKLIFCNFAIERGKRVKVWYLL